MRCKKYQCPNFNSGLINNGCSIHHYMIIFQTPPICEMLPCVRFQFVSDKRSLVMMSNANLEGSVRYEIMIWINDKIHNFIWNAMADLFCNMNAPLGWVGQFQYILLVYGDFITEWAWPLESYKVTFLPWPTWIVSIVRGWWWSVPPTEGMLWFARCIIVKTDWSCLILWK